MEQHQYEELLNLLRQVIAGQEAENKLREYEIENRALKQELLITNALVAAKDETIMLLRGSYRNPN